MKQLFEITDSLANCINTNRNYLHRNNLTDDLIKYINYLLKNRTYRNNKLTFRQKCFMDIIIKKSEIRCRKRQIFSFINPSEKKILENLPFVITKFFKKMRENNFKELNE